MGKIYLFGLCDFEINGIYHLLAKDFCIVNALDYNEILLTSHKHDVLILCLSSLSLLGWGRTLSKIKNLSLNCNIKIIVLTPQHVPRLDFTMQSKQIFFISGVQKIEQLYQSILNAINMPVYCKNKYYTKVTLNERYFQYVMDLVNNKSIADRAVVENISHKTVYHIRSNFLKKIGFSSKQHLQIFLSGINNKDAQLLCSTTRWYMRNETKNMNSERTAQRSIL